MKKFVAVWIGIVLSIVYISAHSAILIHKSPAGWWFEDSDIGLVICRSEGSGAVSCIDEAKNKYMCTWRPESEGYFFGCIKDESL